nr:Peptidase M12A domain containing protein [Haemonchus contortus]
MAKALPLLLFLILILDLSEIVRCLSAEGKESLAKGIPGGDLEKRRERLNHLKELFAKRYLTSVGKEKPTSDGVLEGEEVVANENTDLSVEEINQREGVADYLFDGDIDLTEYRTIVKQALAYISGRTCLTFTESDTAPNRVNVISGSGCYSKIGMVGGVQDLSLGNGCDQMGIVSHEFMHALGSWHMQMRSDRDDHLIVDLTYVKAGYEGNFGKIEADRTNNYNPFDYGSVMQYAANLFTTQGYSMIPRIGKYLMTPGTRIVSFYDIKMLNDHYGCHGKPR